MSDDPRAKMPDNVRPFDNIPEVGYSKRQPSWLMLLTEEHDGFCPILADIESFTITRRGTPDANRRGMSEHDAYTLIAAGIRIGIARERKRAAAGPGTPHEWKRIRTVLGSIAERRADELRADGWTVAVMRDARLDGTPVAGVQVLASRPIGGVIESIAAHNDHVNMKERGQ